MYLNSIQRKKEKTQEKNIKQAISAHIIITINFFFFFFFTNTTAKISRAFLVCQTLTAVAYVRSLRPFTGSRSCAVMEKVEMRLSTLLIKRKNLKKQECKIVCYYQTDHIHQISRINFILSTHTKIKIKTIMQNKRISPTSFESRVRLIGRDALSVASHSHC
jgi:hypothetical protein